MSDLLAPVLSDQWGQDKSWKLSRYEAAGGYRALRKALLGMTQAEVIAEHLIVSESTVKVHVSHLMKKFNVTSRLKLAVAAIRTGSSS